MSSHCKNTLVVEVGRGLQKVVTFDFKRLVGMDKN